MRSAPQLCPVSPSVLPYHPFSPSSFPLSPARSAPQPFTSLHSFGTLPFSSSSLHISAPPPQLWVPPLFCPAPSPQSSHLSLQAPPLRGSTTPPRRLSLPSFALPLQHAGSPTPLCPSVLPASQPLPLTSPPLDPPPESFSPLSLSLSLSFPQSDVLPHASVP